MGCKRRDSVLSRGRDRNGTTADRCPFLTGEAERPREATGATWSKRGKWQQAYSG